MNPQRNHHRQGNFGETVRRRLIKMTGSARRTNVKNVSTNDGEKQITGANSKQKLPPTQRIQTLRCNPAKRNTQQRSRAETDKCAKLLVRPCQQRAQASTRQRNGKG